MESPKQTRTQMEQVKHLPAEVVSDILSRLPIESIMRFKSVCKSWYSLIEDQSFVELQLKRSHSRPHRFILSNFEDEGADKLLLLDTDKGENDPWKARDLNLEYMWKYGEEENYLVFNVVGACNGLLCMFSCFRYGCCSSFYGIFICNPITKECVMLPVSNGQYYSDGQIGFGVDSTGKYKVIQIYKDKFCTTYDINLVKAEIITLGESSWREIDIPYQSYLYSRGDRNIFSAVMVFMNEALYCIIWNCHSDEPIILVFDIIDEKFRTIEFPPSIQMPRYFYIDNEVGLTEIKGSLAVHYRHGLSSVRHIWLLENNKSHGIELYHCDRISVPVPNIDMYLDLVGMLSNNLLLYRVENDSEFVLSEDADPQLVTEMGSQLLVYCLEKKQFMRVQASGAIPTWFHAKSFVPSLVSPISVSCGKTKKDTRSRVQGLHLELVGYSSLWELMDSCRLHPNFRITDDRCNRCCYKRSNMHSEPPNGL